LYVRGRGRELTADEHFWTEGAIESDLIVIDDPQRESAKRGVAERQWHP